MATDSHGMGIPLPADSTKIHEFPKVARAGFEKVAEVIAGGMTEGMTGLAVTEVNKALDGADIITGDDPRAATMGSSPEHLAVVLDANRNETWLGARASDGGPTDWAMEHLRRRLGAGEAVTRDEFLMAVTDAEGYLTDLTIRAEDGQFADFVIERLRPRILAGLDLTPPAPPAPPAPPVRQYARAPWTRGSDVFPVDTDTTRAAGFGSSSMQAIGNRLQTFFAARGAAFYAAGQSGERAENVAARMGSVPALVTAPAGRIPASGPVDVTVSNVPFAYARRAYEGTLAGVPGTLSYRLSAPGSFIFTRATAGTAFTLAPDTPFIPDAEAYRDAVVLLWMGKNNMGTADGDKTAIRLTDASFDWLAPLAKCALVLGHFVDTGTPADHLTRTQIRATNEAHRRRYGRLFVDVSAYVTGSQIWADTGLTPTAEDRAEQALGNKPPSLSSDALHLNGTANDAIMRHLIEPRITSLNWY